MVSAMQACRESVRWGHEIVFTLMMRRLIDAGDDLVERCKHAKEIESMIRRDRSFRSFVMDLIDAEISADPDGQSAMEQGQRRLILVFMSAEGWPLGPSPAAEVHRIASMVEYCAFFGPNACDA
jgi:hypothetical protein